MKNIYLFPTKPSAFLAKAFIAIALLTFAGSMAAWGQTVVTYTSTPSSNWTTPTGVTGVTVEAWGGGGAGGGVAGKYLTRTAGGGGAGGAFKRDYTATPNASYAVAVGAGGTAGTAGGYRGNNGGNSTFGLTLVVANGGGGGDWASKDYQNAYATSGATGTYNGGNGSAGNYKNSSGGGGGGAGNAGSGGNGSNDSPATSGGTGGTGGGGAGGIGKYTSASNGSNGGAAAGLSGGGGGAFANKNADYSGGVGYRGQVVIYYFVLTGVSATTNLCAGTASTVTVSGTATNLPTGSYTVTYNLSSPNTATGATATMTVSSAGSGTFTVPSASLSNTGTTTVTVTKLTKGDYAGGIGANNTASIVVSGSNTAGAASSSPTPCKNTLMTSITHATTGATGIGTATGLPAGVTAAWSSNTITVSGTPTASGTFSYSIPLSGGCGSVSATGTITVLPIASAPTITGKLCAGNTTVGGTSTEADGSTVEVFKGGVSMGTCTVASGLWTITVSALSESSVITAKVKSSNGCYSDASNSVTVGAGISNLSYTTPVSYCTGALITTNSPSITGTGTITYSVNPSLPDGLEINENLGVNAGKISGTPTTATTAANYTVTADNGCNTTTAIINITVNPTPAVSSSASGSVCSGIAQNYDITSTVSGTTYSWSRAAVSGVSNTAVTGQTSNPITETLTNTHAAGGTAVNVTYLITPTTGSCAGTQFTYTVAVHTSSTAASSVTKNPSTIILPGQDVVLTLVGGALGSGDSWVWYEGDCGSGSPVATGASVTVNPMATTTYYVRGEGNCNPTTCASVTVDVSLFNACNEVYVSTSGNDNNPGTPDNPVKTVYKAMQLASSTRNHIRIAAGTYNETNTIILKNNVILDGGWTNSGGIWTKGTAATTINRTAVNVEGPVRAPKITALKAINLTDFTIQDIIVTTASAPSIAAGEIVSSISVPASGSVPTHTEGFETTTAVTAFNTAGSVPTNWYSYVNGTNSNIVAPQVVSGTGSYIYVKSGSKSLHMEAGNAVGTGDKSYAVMPSMSGLSNKTLTFYSGMESTSNGSTLKVGYVTAQSSAACSNFTELTTITSTYGSNMAFQSIDLSGIPSGAYICFYWNHSSSYYACCIDDVNIYNTADMTSSTVTACNYGISTYALHISNSSGYTLNRCSFVAGNAGAGKQLDKPATAANGSNATSRTGGGGGGTSTNGAGSGGAGGDGGNQNYYDAPSGSAYPGSVSTAGSSASTGGAAGGSSQTSVGAGASNSDCTSSSTINGGVGSLGKIGTAGTNAATTATNSTSYSTYFIPSAQGASGNPGGGGSGGSGGGGGRSRYPVFLGSCSDVGGVGGKGGGGGAGGIGGSGGYGGGASFGVYIYNSTGTITNNSVTAGSAGSGGNGSLGGDAGSGGIGANGTAGDYGSGGKGGNGNAGGAGGSGQPGYAGATGAICSVTSGGVATITSGSSIPSTDFTSADYGISNMTGCTNSQIEMVKSSGTLTGTVINDKTPATSSYTTASSPAIVYYTTTGEQTPITNSPYLFIKNTRALGVINGDDDICEESTGVFTYSSSDYTALNWEIHDASGSLVAGSQFTGSDFNYTFDNSGTFYVRLIATSECCGRSIPIWYEVTVSPNITPTFTAVGPYCSGATIPALPTTSNNFITGTWSPAISNTATTTYTFTPTAGQCATTTTLEITINPNVTPTFTAVGPYCSGATIPALPTTSNNSITGTWSPAISNTATTTYTFTPTAGQCATTTTLEITIDQKTIPTFSAVGPYCSGATIPALPTTSNNSITGTWSPAISNTATTTYTFTPSVGQCATTTTLDITINPNITPTFTAVGPYCSGATIPALPTTSNNSITGTWSPAISNTATTTYTFTPTTGQCATTTTLDITINPNITPTFTAVGPYCSGATIPALPTTSNNSITGTWSPAISNTATTTYTFTPTAGQCATTTTLEITINPLPAAVTVSGGGTQSCGSMTLTASGGTGGTIYWQGTTSGGTSTATASSSESVSTSGTYYFRSQSAAGCWGTEGSAIVVTNPNPIVGAPNFTNPTICSGGSTVASSVVSGTGTLSYQWQYYNGSSWANVINNTPAGASYTGATTINLSISGTTALGTHQYRLYVSSSNGCDTYGAGASYSVVVNPTITKQPLPIARICIGGSYVFKVIATGGTPLLTYQWYKGNVEISGATESTYTITGSVLGYDYYHCVVSNDCGSVTSSATWLYVDPDPSAPTATKSPNVDIVCAGETLSLIGVTGVGSFTCNFEFSYNGGDWTYTPTMIAIEGQNTIAVRTNCSNCSGCGNSDATTYSWTALTNPLSASGETTICSGLTADLSTSLDVQETGSYQWQYYNGSAWVNVGTNSSTYTTNALTANTDFRCLYTATDIGCGTAYSNTVTITVNNPPIYSMEQYYEYALSQGNYVWSGNTDTEWETATNWLIMDGLGKFSVAAIPPTSDDKVYFIKYPPCASNHASIPDNSTAATCKDIKIFTELSMGDNSYLNVTGGWYRNGTHGVFNHGTGTVELSGDNIYVQDLGYTIGEGFYNLLISGDGVKIDLPQSINNDLTITGDFVMGFQDIYIGRNWNSVDANVTVNTHWPNRIRFIGSSNSNINTKTDIPFTNIYIKKDNPSSIVSMSNDFSCKSFELNKGTFNVNSYTLDCSDKFIAIPSTATAEDNDVTVNMGSGRINAPAKFGIYKGATVNMTSGIIDCGEFILYSSFDATSVKGRMNMSGGTLYVGSNFVVTKLSLFLGSGGTVIFDGSPAENFDKFEVALSVGEVYFNDVIISDNRIVRMPENSDFYGNVKINGDITINNGASLLHQGGSLFIGGNWDNNGTYTPTGGSTIIFNGAAQQEIQAGGSTFNNVTFNNTTVGNSDINVNEPMTINGTTTFTDGVVNYTSTGSLSFGSSATSTIGNTNSYVNGKISKTGTSAFTFAIGEDEYWGPCAIAAPGSESTITAQYKHKKPLLNWSTAYMCSGSGMHHVSGVEHWLLTSDVSHPAVTLYWSSDAISEIVVLPDLCVAHYNAATPCWENMGGDGSHANVDGIDVGSITSTKPFTSYSPITLGTKTKDNPLPVELTYFNAVCNQAIVNLTWTTATEINNDYFDLQRSIDGSVWETIANIEGAGNSSGANDYNYVDNKPADGINYYRLRQVDYDGTAKLSNMIQVRCADESGKPMIAVYPNPFNDLLFVAADNWDMNSLEVELYDMLGQKLSQWSFAEVSTHCVQQLNIGNLSPAMYIIKIKTSDGVIIKKVEKK